MTVLNALKTEHNGNNAIAQRPTRIEIRFGSIFDKTSTAKPGAVHINGIMVIHLVKLSTFFVSLMVSLVCAVGINSADIFITQDAILV